MDPNIVQVQIVGEPEVLAHLVQLIYVLVAASLAAWGTHYVTMRGIRRTHALEEKSRKQAEETEMQGVYRMLLVGIRGYWQSISAWKQAIEPCRKSESPLLCFSDPSGHRFLGYDANLPAIRKIPDPVLQELAMASDYTIRKLAACIEILNGLVLQYSEKKWAAERNNEDVAKLQAQQLYDWASEVTKQLWRVLDAVNKNLTKLNALLQEKLGVLPGKANRL